MHLCFPNLVMSSRCPCKVKDRVSSSALIRSSPTLHVGHREETSQRDQSAVPTQNIYTHIRCGVGSIPPWTREKQQQRKGEGWGEGGKGKGGESGGQREKWKKDCAQWSLASKPTLDLLCFGGRRLSPASNQRGLTVPVGWCVLWTLLASFSHTLLVTGTRRSRETPPTSAVTPESIHLYSHHCSRPMSPAGRRIFLKCCTPTSRSACLKQNPSTLLVLNSASSQCLSLPATELRQTDANPAAPHTTVRQAPVPRLPRGSTFSPFATTAGSCCTTRSHVAWPKPPRGPHPAAPPIPSLYHWQGSFQHLNLIILPPFLSPQEASCCS